MTKKWNCMLPPLLGLIGAVLRFLQCRTVFEPDTMLSRPHPISTLLPVFLALCAAGFLIRCGKKKTALDFDASFTTPASMQLTGLIASAMLFVAAGAYLIMTNAGGSLLITILGGAAAAAGACLFLAVYGWRKGKSYGFLFLIPVFFGIFWLFVTYQEYASWPVMNAYFVQILAIAAATYGFYQVSACAYGQGSRRALRFILPTAVVLTFTALGDSVPLSVKGLYLASLGALYGFYLCLNNENETNN